MAPQSKPESQESTKQEKEIPSWVKRRERIWQLCGELLSRASDVSLGAEFSHFGIYADIGQLKVRFGREDITSLEKHLREGDVYIDLDTLLEDKPEHREHFGEWSVLHLQRSEPATNTEQAEGEWPQIEGWLGTAEAVARHQNGLPHEQAFPKRASDTHLMLINMALDRKDPESR